MGSNLGGIRMMANTLKRRPEQAATIASRIQDTVSESTESLRDIIWLLAPSLKLRAEKLHAKLEIDSSPGSGTALTLVLNRSKLGF